MQGSVLVQAFSRPVLLIGRENMNRAVQGDVVAIEIFDEKDWKASVDQVIDQEGLPLVFIRPFSAC
jgi:exosome complex exonuclease DIS3/RRP44